MKFLIIALAFISLGSCQALMSKFYGANKIANFESPEEYFSYIEKKKKIPRSAILIPDSSTYNKFMDSIYFGNQLVLYATYLNDSTAIKFTPDLKENMGCLGRVLNELKTNIDSKESIPDSLIIKSDFNNFLFNEASTDEKYQINRSSKPLKVFLLYFYGSGKFFDKTFQEALDFAKSHQNEMDLKVIATDNISIFKPKKY